MTRRVWSLAALAALLVAGTGGTGRAQDTTCNGYEFPNPPNPAVQVTGTGPSQTDVFALHPVQLGVVSGSPGDIEQGSITFTITQPDGTTVTKGPDDRYGGASYTPPVPGGYSVTASWRQ